MAVSNKIILNKMEKEISLAKQKIDDPKLMIKHISHIHLLCEIILDNDEANEVKRLEGNVLDNKKRISDTTVEINNNITSGDSIFDF